VTIKIGYVQSWRPEFRDLICSLSETINWDLLLIRLKPGSSFISGSVDAIVVSDDQDIPLGANNDVPIVRVSWNGAPEVLASIASHSNRANEFNLTFFTDVALELSKNVPTIQVPFAFSQPSCLRAPSIRRIGFIGEVDISGNCFHKFGPRLAELARTSSAECSEEIVKAQVNIDEVFRNPPYEISSDTNLLAAWKWNINNWIRWRLVTTLLRNYPSQIDLRGNDWIRLGYRAKKSRFNPLFREYAYQRNAVSIDFGSKSTTDSIYPRSAEIIVNHGGLLQLSSGSNQHKMLPVLERHQFKSEAEMLEKVEERFSGNRKIWSENDVALSDEFSELRSTAIDDLLESFHSLLKS
jgi:hypothetical protein